MNSDTPNPYRPPDSNQFYEAASGSRGEKLIVLSTHIDSPEAHLFRNELADHGIESRLSNETTTSVFGATIAGQSSAFWIEVLVLESDVEQALEIKNRWLASKDRRSVDAEEEISEWICKCGETVDAGFEICWNCGAELENPDQEETL